MKTCSLNTIHIFIKILQKMNKWHFGKVQAVYQAAHLQQK